MQPAGSPPWRVIDSPPTTGAAAPGAPDGAAPRPGPAGRPGITLDVRVLATIGVTVACAVVAFILAFGTGAGTTVIEGGTAIEAGPSAAASAGAASPTSGCASARP